LGRVRSGIAGAYDDPGVGSGAELNASIPTFAVRLPAESEAQARYPARSREQSGSPPSLDSPVAGGSRITTWDRRPRDRLEPDDEQHRRDP
jgi:hypothetical protein